jgi:hypothetical protein
MEIECIRSTVLMIIPMFQTREALIRKLHAAKVRPSGRQGKPFGCGSNQERISVKFWKANRTVVGLDALCLPSE